MLLAGTLYQLVSPFQKYPPGPAYLLFFGGMALLLISGLLFAKKAQWFQSPLRFMETMGRNSLLTFLLQYFVYYTVLHWLVTRTNLITPLTAWTFLLLSILGQVALIMLLDRYHIRRLWTVGLPGLLQFLAQSTEHRPIPPH